MTKQEFIDKVAFYVQKYAPQYDIKVISPIIAQACCESAYGVSKLSAKYHNYFGLKCGSAWKGKSVKLSTGEEYTVGTITKIKDNFRVYDTMEAGIKGYFEFIQAKRYANLKGVTDPQTYLENIKADGYATSSTYVRTNMNIIAAWGLTKYDTSEVQADTSEDAKRAVALDVILGKYGNGTVRQKNLEAKGYDYREIQKLVNKILKENKQ